MCTVAPPAAAPPRRRRPATMVQTSVHACARVTAFFELFLGLQSACAAQLAFVYELVLGAMRASEDGNGQRCERSARSSLPLPRSFPAAGRRLRRRVFFFLYRHRASGQRPRRELSKSFRLPSAPSFPLPDPSRPPAGACGAGFFSFFTGNTSKKSPFFSMFWRFVHAGANNMACPVQTHAVRRFRLTLPRCVAGEPRRVACRSGFLC